MLRRSAPAICKMSTTLHGKHLAKHPTSTTLHGNTSRTCKMSVALHGNIYLSVWSRLASPKGSRLNYVFQYVLQFFEALLEYPRCAHEKMKQPTWAPKSAHSECSKQLVFNYVFKMFFFCGHLWLALRCDPLSKCARRYRLTPSLGPC